MAHDRDIARERADSRREPLPCLVIVRRRDDGTADERYLSDRARDVPGLAFAEAATRAGVPRQRLLIDTGDS